MKRILFVIPFLSSGGAERVVSIWASELAKLGSDVHVLVFYRVNNEYPLDEKVNIHTMKDNKYEYDELTRFSKIIELRKAFREIKPDFVLPFIFYVGLMTTLASTGLPLKIVETIRIDPRYSPQKTFVRWLRNISVFLSKRCIVQNELQKEYFPKWLQRRIVVFPNPISNVFVQCEKVFVNKEIRNVIAVGRLERQKNHYMLIRAFAKIAEANKKVKLKIYGEGSLYSELNDYIKQNELSDRVFLCGRTNDICKALQECDLFILSSDAEGMPNSLMEAMALGLPCISTDCETGPSDLIKDGVNGYLIPVGDEEALVQRMNDMIENIDDAIKMGKRARETIIESYTAEMSARKLLDFIESI